MDHGASLETVLASDAAANPSATLTRAAALVILKMAEAAIGLAELIARPPLDGRLGATTGGANSDGDRQRRLDIDAEDMFAAALRRAPVACYLSEEVEDAVLFDEGAPLCVAIDPLDGSSNIDVNAPIGTIFSLLPMVAAAKSDPVRAFLQTGRAQIGAGFFVYGPQTSLVLTLGDGVKVFVLDTRRGEFVLTQSGVTIPQGGNEYAINASNARHWRAPVRRYVDHCIAGAEGPHGHNFNMRWIAALVADSYRIFVRGGVFLYPGDGRPGYENGRLRLMYEANPIALLAEQAGGGATDGLHPILDRVPKAPHERSPLIMGSVDKVEEIKKYFLDRSAP